MPTKVSALMLTDGAREEIIPIRGPASNGTYPVFLAAPYDFEIISAAYQTDTGTIDWRLEIDGTEVEFTGGDGSENLEADNVADADTTDAASTVTAGDPVTLVLSSAASSPTLISIDIKVRRLS